LWEKHLGSEPTPIEYKRKLIKKGDKGKKNLSIKE